MAASLAQRLFATSGRATLADLPVLYGAIEAARAARAAAQGAGQGPNGAQKAQQLTALSGGGAPGSDTSGGGGFDFPTAPGVSAPGATGGDTNFLRTLMDDRGRSEGGGFTGASNLTSNSDRYALTQRHGTAPLTAENMGILASNVMGLMSGTAALTSGAGSIAELASGQPPGTFGGIQPFHDYQSIPMINGRPPQNFGEIMDAIHQSNANRDAAARARMDRAAAVTARGQRGIGAYRGSYSGGGGSGNAGGAASLGRDTSAHQAGTTGAPGVY